MNEVIGTHRYLIMLMHNHSIKEKLREYIPSHLRDKPHSWFNKHRHILDAHGYGADVIAGIETGVYSVLPTARKVPMKARIARKGTQVASLTSHRGPVPGHRGVRAAGPRPPSKASSPSSSARSSASSSKRNRHPPPQRFGPKLEPVASSDVPEYLGGTWSAESEDIVKTLLQDNYEQEMCRMQNKARRLAKSKSLHSVVDGTGSASSLECAAAPSSDATTPSMHNEELGTGYGNLDTIFGPLTISPVLCHPNHSV